MMVDPRMMKRKPLEIVESTRPSSSSIKKPLEIIEYTTTNTAPHNNNSNSNNNAPAHAKSSATSPTRSMNFTEGNNSFLSLGSCDDHHHGNGHGHDQIQGQGMTEDLVRAFFVDYYEDLNNTSKTRSNGFWNVFFTDKHSKDYKLITPCGNLLDTNALIAKFTKGSMILHHSSLVSVDNLILMMEGRAAAVTCTADSYYAINGTEYADRKIITSVLELQDGQVKLIQEHKSKGSPIPKAATRWESEDPSSHKRQLPHQQQDEDESNDTSPTPSYECMFPSPVAMKPSLSSSSLGGGSLTMMMRGTGTGTSTSDPLKSSSNHSARHVPNMSSSPPYRDTLVPLKMMEDSLEPLKDEPPSARRAGGDPARRRTSKNGKSLSRAALAAAAASATTTTTTAAASSDPFPTITHQPQDSMEPLKDEPPSSSSSRRRTSKNGKSLSRAALAAATQVANIKTSSSITSTTGSDTIPLMPNNNKASTMKRTGSIDTMMKIPRRTSGLAVSCEVLSCIEHKRSSKELLAASSSNSQPKQRCSSTMGFSRGGAGSSSTTNARRGMGMGMGMGIESVLSRQQNETWGVPTTNTTRNNIKSMMMTNKSANKTLSSSRTSTTTTSMSKDLRQQMLREMLPTPMRRSSTANIIEDSSDHDGGTDDDSRPSMRRVSSKDVIPAPARKRGSLNNTSTVIDEPPAPTTRSHSASTSNSTTTNTTTDNDAVMRMLAPGDKLSKFRDQMMSGSAKWRSTGQ